MKINIKNLLIEESLFCKLSSERRDVSRKGYSSIEQQIAANKRYLEKNPAAKEKQKKFAAKSQAKKYILELADNDELKEVQEWIDSRK